MTSKTNIDLFKNSKLILNSEIIIIEKFINDFNLEIKDLKDQFNNCLYKTISFEEKIKTINSEEKENEEELQSLNLKLRCLMEEKENNDSIKEIIKDDLNRFEQQVLLFNNLKIKCKELIETIDSKIESPDDNGTTDSDLKNELVKINDFMKDEMFSELEEKKVNQFIENEFEIKDIKLE